MNNLKSYQTKQKNIIKELFINNPDKHFTVEQILLEINNGVTSVSKATLYRALDNLVSLGEVIKFNLDGMCSCYLYNNKEHSEQIHLKCEECGNVFHIDSKVVKGIDSKLMKECGFLIDNKRTMLYGVCDSCRGGNNE